MRAEKISNLSTLILLGLVAIVGVFTLDVYLPGMPAMAEQFDVSLNEIAYTFTAFSVVYAITQLFHGPISDAIGRKPVLIGGLAVAAIATLVCSIAENYYYLFAARLLQAMGISSFVVVNAIVRDLYTGVKAVQVRAMIATACGVSISIAPSVGGLLQETFNWQGGFYASLILIIAALLYTAVFFTESNDVSKRLSHKKSSLLHSYLQLFKNNKYTQYVCMAMLAYAVHFTFIIMSSGIFIHEIGLTPAVFGFWMIIYGGIYFISGLLAGWLAKKLSVSFLIVAGAVLIGIGGCMMLLMLESGIRQVLLPMGVATMGITTVRALAITGALAPLSTNAGQGAAGLNLIQFTASALIATGVSEINAKPEVLLGLFAAFAAILILYLKWRIVSNENIDSNACLV